MSYIELKAELSQFKSYCEFYYQLFDSPCITGILMMPNPIRADTQLYWEEMFTKDYYGDLGSQQYDFERRVFAALKINNLCKESNPDYKRFREYYHVSPNDGHI